jgi:hypothetical protein
MRERLSVVCHRRYRVSTEVTTKRIDDYLRLGQRPIQALLSADRLQPLGAGRFVYRSRPVNLLRWQVAPRVVFRAQWQEKALRVVFEQCLLEGATIWEQLNELIGFNCRANLSGEGSHIVGEATTSVAIEQRGLLRLVSPILLRQLAEQTLEATLDRLVRRCERGLRKDLHRWARD